MSTPVLKQRHSLVGKSPFGLIGRLREADTPPLAWAQLKKGHPVTEYNTQQLKTELEGLVGCGSGDLLKAAGKKDCDAHLRLALHFAILEANSTGQPAGKVPAKPSGDREGGNGAAAGEPSQGTSGQESGSGGQHALRGKADTKDGDTAQVSVASSIQRR